MASVTEEFEGLKIRIGKGGINDKLTVIDHTSGEKISGTAIELFQVMKIRKEKGEGEHVVHIVDHAEEKKRKRTNPDKSTRIMLNCRTPEQWKEFQMAKERYYDVAVDPHIAIDCMVRALNAFSAGVIADWVKQGFGPGQAPPKAEIPEMEDLPEWLRE